MTTALAPLKQRLALTITLEDPPEGDEAPAGGDRTFTALGVPYDEELKRMDWSTGASRQKWAADSISLAEDTLLYWRHDWQMAGVPIGLILSAEQTPEGIKITGRLSTTIKAEEIYTLMKDGVLKKVSGGLETTAWHLEDDGDLLVHDDSTAWEFSIVDTPAYDTAAISNVNSTNLDKENPMSTGTIDLSKLASADDLAALSTSLTDLNRKVDTLPTTLGNVGGTAPLPFTRYGEFVKALALGDAEAINLAQFITLSLKEQDKDTTAKLTTLAYTGGTVADLGDWLKASWIGDFIAYVEANRKLHNYFSSSALPATGMSVEYGLIDTNTLAVTKQAAEGDTLAFGKISFKTATAPVRTYGGYTQFSKQVIERSSMAVIEKAFRFLAIAYAKVSEADLKTLAMAAGSATPLAGAGVTDLTTANGWNSFLLHAAEQLEDNWGVAPTGLIVGYDVFEDLLNLTEASANDKYLTRENGNISAATRTGNVHKLEIIPISTGATTDFVRVAHPEALQTFGSPNPTQLRDGDVTNLTEAFSVYGYEAQASTAPGLMIAPDVTA